MAGITNSAASRKFTLVIVLLVVTDLAVLLNIPVMREILGFLFLTIIPGLLFLWILRLDKLSVVEKFVLSVGLSLSFSMFFGLLINWIYPLLGYNTPLSTTSVIGSFSVILIILTAVAYIRNRTASLVNSPNSKLGTSQKAFLLVPAFFPLLSILGMHLMNTTNNNSVLMVLLLLIPAYAILIAIKHAKVSDRVYPGIIFLTSISLVLLLGLRSNHIIGADIHTEYYLFQLTSNSGQWQIFIGEGSLDSCLSISLLPTIYQSLINMDPEYLYKTLYPFLYSISPLVVYIISKKYIGGFYAFLASFFFMSQTVFLLVASNPRTCLAVLLFALSVMILFQDGLSGVSKKLLFMVFAASCIVTHYATTYIFFFILLLIWLGMRVIPLIFTARRKLALSVNSPDGDPPRSSSQSPEAQTVAPEIPPRPESYITIYTVALFFVMLFLWQGVVTVAPFSAGVDFVFTTLQRLSQFLILESRAGDVATLFGVGLEGKSLPRLIELIFSWLMIALIAISILATLVRYRQVVTSPKGERELPEFLSQKFDVTFFILSLTCCLVLVIAVALPSVSIGYDVHRISMQMMVVLSPFFVIGGIMMARFLHIKWAYLVVLMVLIPYFMSTTGITSQLLGVPDKVTLNAEGNLYDILYVHDQESHAASWIGEHADERARIYSDSYGTARLTSQGGIWPQRYARALIENNEPIGDGYIYLRYFVVIKGKLLARDYQWHDMAEYQHEFDGRNLIYTNGGSEIYK